MVDGEGTGEKNVSEESLKYKKKFREHAQIPEDDSLTGQKKKIRKRQIQKQMTKEQKKSGRLSFDDEENQMVKKRAKEREEEKKEFRWIQLDGGKYRISKKSFDDWLDNQPEGTVDYWIRIPKKSFQEWYEKQSKYRTQKDRKKDEELE